MSRSFKKNFGYAGVKALKKYLDRLLGAIYTPALFPEKPTMRFYPETSMCCELPLNIWKTREKTVVTLDIGEFNAKETVLECSSCGSIYTSGELQSLVSPWCNIGYDLLVYVGKSIFLKFRNEKEIQNRLQEKDITISVSGISYLAKRFIVYLALAHRQSHSMLKKAMDKRGGYILHIDGTCDGDSPHLISGLDGISEIVLDNIKLPSEKAEKIIPFLIKIKEKFGNPLALVHDMGKGILKAVEEVFHGIADFICHFHFLRDIGKDLFGEENDLLRNRLKHHGIQGKLRKIAIQLKKITDCSPGIIQSLGASQNNQSEEVWTVEQTSPLTVYTMIQWALEGKKEGNGYGFPFDRPYLDFYKRLQILHADCGKYKEMVLHDCPKGSKHFDKIHSLLEGAMADKVLQTTALEMEKKVLVFDKLRDAMRIADPEQTQGINDNGEDVEIKTIQKEVETFRYWLVNNDGYSKSKGYQKMVAQMDKYWEKLFAAPITVDTPEGSIAIQPQRTNNILERFFRDIKRGYRKKSGVNSISKTLKAMLADTPLIKNLKNPEYLEILLDSKTTLAERFAQIDSKTVRKELKKTQEDSEKVPSEIRKIIKNPQLPKVMENFMVKQLENQKSNQVLR